MNYRNDNAEESDVYENIFKDLEENHNLAFRRLETRMNKFRELPYLHGRCIEYSFSDRALNTLIAQISNHTYLTFCIELSKTMQLNYQVQYNWHNDDFKIFTDVLLRQAYREWSIEGEKERIQCFKPIVRAFCEIYPKKIRHKLNVLVPGAGLGRLVYEIAKTGCTCVYNDNDIFMILMSYGFLNVLYNVGSFKIYPWANEWSVNYSESQTLNPVTVPDIKVDPKVKISTAFGDFCEIFNNEYSEYYDCIITCFFIDAAKNVIEVIDKIYYILKNDGIWINLGPLNYYYTYYPEKDSVEITLEELYRIIFERYKFKSVRDTKLIDCQYASDERLMIRSHFNCTFFIVKK